jgi:hypothetical protein
MNEDGYWIRASDFNLFLDKKGKFHVIPHDLNETFLPVGGPGGPGGPGGRRGPGGPGGPGGPPPGFDGPPPDLPRPNGPPPGDESRPGRPRPVGVALDPLAGVGDADKPLLTKLLAVPSLKERYLRYVKTIVENDLDWSKVEPIVQRHRDRIDADVQADTRKLESHAAFVQGLGLEAPAGESRPAEGRRRPSLREFFEQRRAYLLANENLQGVKPLTEKERTPAK